MQALEFETDIKNEFIKIPSYNKRLNKHAKVIILFDEQVKTETKTPQKQKKRKFNHLFDDPINVDHYQNIKRNSLHER